MGNREKLCDEGPQRARSFAEKGPLPAVADLSKFRAVSTTALHIVELVKSLPREEQEAICAELAQHAAQLGRPKGRVPQRLADGTYYNPDGIPDDDPFFRIMEEQDAARRDDPGPPAPELD